MYWFAFIALFWTSLSLAAEIPNGYIVDTTDRTTTSATYSDITGTTLGGGSGTWTIDSDFIVGKAYRIEYTASIAETSNGGEVCIVMLHGSTQFEGSEICPARSSTNQEYYAAKFGTVWTAVTGESLKLQFKSTDGTTTAHAQFITVRAIRLTDYLVNGTDYCFDERPTDDSLMTTPTDGASCTITMASPTDLLVETYSQIDIETGGGTVLIRSKIVRSGEASSSNPTADFQPADVGTIYGIGLARVFSVGTGSNTFKEQSESGSDTIHDRWYSNVFVLNLGKFTAHNAVYTSGSTTLGTSEYGNTLASFSLTAVTGNLWIGASLIGARTATNGDVEARIQIDGTDAVSGMTAASLNYDNLTVTTTTDQIPIALGTTANVSSGSRTITLDASSDAATALDAGQITMYAFTLDMPVGSVPYILTPLVMQ